MLTLNQYVNYRLETKTQMAPKFTLFGERRVGNAFD